MVGRTISHYQLIEKLGAGGMGEIYRALDTRLSRAVAIKVLFASHAGDAERRRRFLQEARAASALNHPNIITIHDVLLEDDTEFIVMEFVAGKTLAELIPPTGLSIGDVLRYGVQIADALGAAHAAGIIHRDLKPANVMVTPSGLVKILDFGLAKQAARANAAAALGDATATFGGGPLTVEGSILGTIAYMSPEQAEGKPIDGRSDIFSFGVVLYEMVTGRRAFSGDSALSTLTAILRDDVRPVSETAAGAPPMLDQIVRRCLSKNPAARWQSMQEVREELIGLQRNSDALTAISLPQPRRRRRSPAILAGAAAVLLAAGGVWWMTGRHSPAPPLATPAPPAPGAPPIPLPATDGGVLTNEGIIAMVRAHVSAPVILQQIRFSQTRFDLSTPEVIRLSGAGVSAEILDAMRNPRRAPAAPPQPAAEKQPTAQKSAAETPAAEQPAAPAVAQSVIVPDGMPILIRLAEDIPADAEAGRTLRFTAVRDFRVGETTVVAANAAVTGEVVDAAKKKLLAGTKVTFRLKDIAAVDGSRLPLRATISRRASDGRRPVDVSSMARHAKDVAAPAGTEYVAYSDGEHTVVIRK